MKLNLMSRIGHAALIMLAASALQARSALAVTAGDMAPDFTAINQDGKSVHLSELRGKPVLLYFYPQDETPGCTKEACAFRDGFSKFRGLGAVVLGVSRQGQQSHHEFHEKHHLPFDLLADQDGSISRAYGVGLIPVIGLDRRQSVLIGPNGKVLKFYGDVDPAKHADEVLADIAKSKG